MSRFSGKCDFYDQIFMSQSQDMSELGAFQKFKEATDGVIYQHFILTLNNQNINYEMAHNEAIKKNDDGTYDYFGTTYKTLKQINKVGYLAERAIHFDTLLDLVKYFPYLVSISAYYKGKLHIVISANSFVDSEYMDMRRHGYDSHMYKYYDSELSKEYVRIAQLEEPV